MDTFIKVETLHNCPRCNIEKPRNHFTSGRMRSDSTCLECKKNLKILNYLNRERSQGSAAMHRERAREYYHRHIEKERLRVRSAARRARNERPEYMLFCLARQRARNKGLEFYLTIDDVMIPDRCPILGLRLHPVRDGDGDWSCAPTLDRSDNALGYVRGNVTVISRKANMIKSFGTAEEHRRIADWLEGLPVAPTYHEAKHGHIHRDAA